MTTGTLSSTYTVVRCPYGHILAEVWGAVPVAVKARCGDRDCRKLFEVRLTDEPTGALN